LSRNIILLGPSGAGKSSTASLLSEKLALPCLDCDAVIEERAGQSIASLFKEQGEQAFRALENQLLDQLLDELRDELLHEPKVIACGGGLPIGSGNMEKLKTLGQTIYLTAEVETLAKRIASQCSRPLLAPDQPEQLIDKIKQLLTSRRHIYEQAHLTIKTDGKTVPEVVAEIQRILTNATL
jgi:shikimate kinase